MLERTIWERLRKIPKFMRSHLRRQMAEAMQIDSHSVLKHLQARGWLRLKPLYQKYLCELTKLEAEQWEQPDTYLIIHEDTMRFRLVELAPEDLEVQEQREGVLA